MPALAPACSPTVVHRDEKWQYAPEDVQNKTERLADFPKRSPALELAPTPTQSPPGQSTPQLLPGHDCKPNGSTYRSGLSNVYSYTVRATHIRSRSGVNGSTASGSGWVYRP